MDTSRVFFTISELKIVTAQHVLKEAGIVSFVINKVDRAHGGAFGDIELYVNKDDAQRAREILIDEEVLYG